MGDLYTQWNQWYNKLEETISIYVSISGVACFPWSWGAIRLIRVILGLLFSPLYSCTFLTLTLFPIATNDESHVTHVLSIVVTHHLFIFCAVTNITKMPSFCEQIKASYSAGLTLQALVLMLLFHGKPELEAVTGWSYVLAAFGCRMIIMTSLIESTVRLDQDYGNVFCFSLFTRMKILMCGCISESNFKTLTSHTDFRKADVLWRTCISLIFDNWFQFYNQYAAVRLLKPMLFVANLLRKRIYGLVLKKDAYVLKISYRVIKELGDGTYGIVWKALNIQSNEIVSAPIIYQIWLIAYCELLQ